MTLTKRQLLLPVVLAVLSIWNVAPAASSAAGHRRASIAHESPSQHTGGFWSRLTTAASGQRGVSDAWLGAVRSAAEAHHPFAEVAVTGTPSNGQLDGVSTQRNVGLAGDFDGDRRSDVVDLAQTVRRYGWFQVVDHYDVTAFGGATGRRLWTARVTPPELRCSHPECGFIERGGFAFPASTGSEPGVQVVTYSLLSDHEKWPAFNSSDPRTWSPPSSLIFAIDLVLIDHMGHPAWARHLQGRMDIDGQQITMNAVPLVMDVGRIESGLADDWLLTVSDGRVIDNGIMRDNVNQQLNEVGIVPYVPDGDLFASQAIVLDGQNGTLRKLGPAAQGPAAVRELALVRDLSGDGRDDLIETRPFAENWHYMNTAGDGGVSALRSSDGARLWQQVSSIDAPRRVTSAGDVTGDGRDDVLVFLDPSTTNASAAVELLDGVSGAIIWQKPAETALGLGDIRHSGHANVLLGMLDSKNQGTVHLAAVDATGGTLWSATMVVPRDSIQIVALQLREAGDLDGDGLADVDLGVFTTTVQKSRDTTTTHHGYVGASFLSTRTGRLLPRALEQAPIYGSLDGHGADAITSDSRGVTVRSGITGKPLWQVDFGRPVGSAYAETDGSKGHCGNLLAYAYIDTSKDDHSVVAAMFDHSGRLLWTKTLGRPVKAHPRTASKTYRCS